MKPEFVKHPTLAALACALLAAPLLPTVAIAAESYDSCAGTITTLPAVISTQGVWCLKQDLATLSASGTAITVNANNVTLDCNGFKLGGLAAGLGTATVGIDASGRSNLTVRGCNVRGFYIGVLTDDSSGGGHVIEDNRFDGNTLFGIYLYGDGSVIRRNQVLDTGGTTGPAVLRVAGIFTEGNIDILDNTVRVVDSTSQVNGFSYGIIVTEASAASVAGNRVSGIVADPAMEAYSIRPFVTATGVAVRDNDLVGADSGITCSSAANVAFGNSMFGYQFPISGCTDDGNTVYP